MKDQREAIFKGHAASDRVANELKLRDGIVRQLVGEQLETMILKSNNKGPLEVVRLLSGH
jgi:hypothetical protein